MKKYILFLIFTLSPTLYAYQTIYILIHGTWATNGQWFAPGGTFYDTLQAHVDQTREHVISFNWSGINSDAARDHGARMLHACITSYPHDTQFIIIAHSHGGNVAIKASHYLAQHNSNHKINTLITLATPVYRENGYPHMDYVDQLYHFFSCDDIVQPVFGIFKREFDAHERIENIRLTLDGQTTAHSDVRTPLLIPIITELSKKICAWRAAYTDPLHIHIYKNNSYEMHSDTQRNKIIAFDAYFTSRKRHLYRKLRQQKSRLFAL